MTDKTTKEQGRARLEELRKGSRVHLDERDLKQIRDEADHRKGLR